MVSDMLSVVLYKYQPVDRETCCFSMIFVTLPIINSLVIIKISLTNLVFELIIQKNFYSQTSLVRLI